MLPRRRTRDPRPPAAAASVSALPLLPLDAPAAMPAAQGADRSRRDGARLAGRYVGGRLAGCCCAAAALWLFAGILLSALTATGRVRVVDAPTGLRLGHQPSLIVEATTPDTRASGSGLLVSNPAIVRSGTSGWYLDQQRDGWTPAASTTIAAGPFGIILHGWAWLPTLAAFSACLTGVWRFGRMYRDAAIALGARTPARRARHRRPGQHPNR